MSAPVLPLVKKFLLMIIVAVITFLWKRSGVLESSRMSIRIAQHLLISPKWTIPVIRTTKAFEGRAVTMTKAHSDSGTLGSVLAQDLHLSVLGFFCGQTDFGRGACPCFLGCLSHQNSTVQGSWCAFFNMEKSENLRSKSVVHAHWARYRGLKHKPGCFHLPLEWSIRDR